MKSIVTAVCLALASTAMPTIAAAQNSTAAPTIVVTGKYQSDWNKGNQLEADGIVESEKANQDLERYNAELVRAQSARDTAQSRSINARSEFHSLASKATSISDPDRARDLGQEMTKFGNKWEDLNDTVRSAENDISKASKKQRKAQAAVDKAQTKIDRGQAMKAEAKRQSEARNLSPARATL